MSRTDKDRPGWVQTADPLNRRFRKKGSYTWWWGEDERVWKKLWPASQCWCCSNRAWLPYKRRRRSGWKREVRHDLGD